MTQAFRTEVLEQLCEMGSDTTRLHNFDFYMYLPTQSAANRTADMIRAKEFGAKVVVNRSGENWLCRAALALVPQTAPLEDIRTFLGEIESELGGDFDGWESDVVRSTS
jgi:hypothetical protein